MSKKDIKIEGMLEINIVDHIMIINIVDNHKKQLLCCKSRKRPSKDNLTLYRGIVEEKKRKVVNLEISVSFCYKIQEERLC